MRNLTSNELLHVYGGGGKYHKNSGSYSNSYTRDKHKHNSSNSYSRSHSKDKCKPYKPY